jgi:hypothetical protein
MMKAFDAVVVSVKEMTDLDNEITDEEPSDADSSVLDISAGVH